MRILPGELQSGWTKLALQTAAVGLFTVPVLAGMLTVTFLRAQAQSDSTDGPKFEVAAIRVNKNLGSGKLNLNQAGGHLTASNVSLKFLIIQAYQIERVHFASNPAGGEWIDSEHFDIEAVAEGNPSVEQKRLMIQSLLTDRFKLTMHHETRQLPEYALTLSKAGKTGPQLHPHANDAKCVDIPAGQPNPPIVPGTATLPPCGGLRMINGNLIGQEVTVEKLAETLSVTLSRNVVDRTGLGGTFDLNLHFQIVPLDADANASESSGPPSLATALQEQLGLKLQTQTGSVEVFVIDHVEEPSPN
jgi:uncharacterized protein (TIGR03435 family)